MSPTAEPASAAHPVRSVAAAARLIADGEQIVLALKPSGLFVLLVSAPLGLALLVVILAGFLFDRMGVPCIDSRLLLVVCVVATLARLVIAGLQWLSRLYILTDRRVIRVKGVLRVQVFECALSRIQHTELVLSLPERIFGLGTVLFATAGTGAAEAAWAVIAKPAQVHEVVVEYVRRAQPNNGLGSSR